MCVGVMGTALASPLYPLYQARWDLLPSHITGIYVAYMLGALASLLFLGRLSDRFGFLPVLRSGLWLVTAGVLLSALAWNVPAFVVSRVAIGIASGMITTSASIGMTQLSRSGNVQHASAMTSFAMSLGFGLGPLVGGVLAQWLPQPLVTAYVPSVLLGALAVYALYRVQVVAPAPATAARQWRDWLPRITLPVPALRRPFFIACFGAFSTFGIFGLYASLAPSFMGQMLPWHGPAVSGMSIALILFLSAGVQWLARPVHTKTCILWGLGLLAAGNVWLMATTYSNWPLLFVFSLLTTAAGHGLVNLAGIAIVNKVARPDNRSGLLSTYLVVGYIGTIAPILGVGWLSDHVGLSVAIEIFCVCMALLTGTLAWLAYQTPVIEAA
ncbi:MAG: MFS transporter [Rhodoferax sp.]|nr:MFS transporter [Rhodoferax sp.]